MREIKFRGKVNYGEWNDLDGMWVYGNLVKTHQNAFGEQYCRYDIIDDEEDEWLIYKDNCENGDTVSQFTGLTDKNGKEIYEGDIVKRSNTPLKDEALYVFYNQLHACYALKSNYGCTYEPISDFGAIEVVGNIWDNSEMIKGEKHNEKK